MANRLPTIAVILVRPAIPGNVGAVARVMANFSFSRLVLVDPQCNHLSDESRNRAKHAQAVLKKAEVVGAIEDAGCDWLVGTSGKLGNDYNIPRLPLSPWQVAGRLVNLKKRSVGLVFGPEASGLSNEELRLCDSFISIPTNKDYPVLNLSHSAAVVLYELHIASLGKPIPFTPIGAKDKEVLLKRLEEVLLVLPFQTEDQRETQRLVWHRLIGKSFLTRREAFALLGFFRKVLAR